jgi:hypothetical protein
MMHKPGAPLDHRATPMGPWKKFREDPGHPFLRTFLSIRVGKQGVMVYDGPSNFGRHS